MLPYSWLHACAAAAPLCAAMLSLLASLLLLLLAAASPSASSGPLRPLRYPGGNWTAHRLFEAAKTPPAGTHAVCLDGSPPLYYYSAGFGDGVDKWEIHMEGGAWCGENDCATWWGYRE
jgi:hypothetical protein